MNGRKYALVLQTSKPFEMCAGDSVFYVNTILINLDFSSQLELQFVFSINKDLDQESLKPGRKRAKSASGKAEYPKQQEFHRCHNRAREAEKLGHLFNLCLGYECCRVSVECLVRAKFAIRCSSYVATTREQ